MGRQQGRKVMHHTARDDPAARSLHTLIGDETQVGQGGHITFSFVLLRRRADWSRPSTAAIPRLPAMHSRAAEKLGVMLRRSPMP